MAVARKISDVRELQPDCDHIERLNLECAKLASDISDLERHFLGMRMCMYICL